MMEKLVCMYPVLSKLIALSDYTMQDVAATLGIHSSSLRRKMTGGQPCLRRSRCCLQMAPYFLNLPQFMFALSGNQVSAKAGRGFYTGLDLGIMKYHFEIAAGKENFEWV